MAFASTENADRRNAGRGEQAALGRQRVNEIPCDIDYQLSVPVDSSLMGIDYVEAWLKQLLAEARWIARFDVDSCVRVLERVCPDYRGLHVNLYDLLLPHTDKLTSVRSSE